MTDTPAPRAGTRVGCCKDWPKPCTYHQGYEDGLEDGRLEGAQRLVDAGYVDQDQADAVLAADEDGDEA